MILYESQNLLLINFSLWLKKTHTQTDHIHICCTQTQTISGLTCFWLSSHTTQAEKNKLVSEFWAWLQAC